MKTTRANRVTTKLQTGKRVWASHRDCAARAGGIAPVEVLLLRSGSLFGFEVFVRGLGGSAAGAMWWTQAVFCDDSAAALYHRFNPQAKVITTLTHAIGPPEQIIIEDVYETPLFDATCWRCNRHVEECACSEGPQGFVEHIVEESRRLHPNDQGVPVP